MCLCLALRSAPAAVFDYSAPYQEVTVQASASSVLLSVVDGQGTTRSTVVATGPSEDRLNVNGVVSWSSGGTVYFYTYDPLKTNWVGQADVLGQTYDLFSRQGVVTWSSGSTVYYRVYDQLRGAWRSGSAVSGFASGLLAADGVVSWNSASGVYFRVYDVLQGNWIGGTGPGPTSDLLNRSGVVAWSANGVVYYQAYDPSRASWRSGAQSGATFDLKLNNGVVAWSANPMVYLRVYDPLRGQWMTSSVNSGYTTDLAIANSTVTWSTTSGFFLRGYQPGSGQWTANTAGPAAIFAAGPTVGDAPLLVAFVDMSLAGGAASWNFGDGGTSTQRSPFYRYTTFGRFTATLEVGGSVTNRVIVTDTLPPTGTNRINNGDAIATNVAVTLTLQASDNSGVVTDLRLANGTSTWSAWEPYVTSHAWTLTPGNGLRTVYAQFRDAAGNTSAPAPASIQLDTSGPPEARFVNRTVNENVGTATVQVNLSRASLLPVTLFYATANGTATAGQDYTAREGWLSFPPGVTNASFGVPILADSLVELDETILLNFSNLTNATAGPSGTLTIGDDEVPSVFLANTNFSALESSGAALITVQLSGASGQVVTVGYGVSTNETSGGATPGIDYQPVQGVLVFEPGQTSQTFAVPLLDDVSDELTESVTVFLTGATNAVPAPPQTARLSILDDDNPVVFFSNDLYEAFENTLPTISIWLSKPFHQEVRVNYSVAGGTASPGSDYIAMNGALSILPGTTNAEVLVNLINDTLSEDDESIRIRLVNASGASLGPRVEAELRVLDDDRAPRLLEAGLDATGHFRATAYGPPGQKFEVQKATSLTGWVPLLTLTNISGRTTFTDPTTSLATPQRFYRTMLP